jgi:Flp pilus assembly protein CpaB
MQAKTVGLLFVAAILVTTVVTFELTRKGSENKNQANRRDGMERFSLSMQLAQVQGGFVQPRWFVDISYQVERDKKTISKILAESVQIIAIDQTCNLYADGPPPVCILQVTAEQARILNSQKGGRFTLTLRGDNLNAMGEFIK